MEHKHLEDRLFIRLDSGEEVMSSLTTLCKDHGISCARLTAIGAVQETELGYYDLPTYSYLTQTIPEICELVSMIGNVALVDGEPFVHAHASLGRRDLSLVGGHVVRATVAVTVEAFLDTSQATLERVFNDDVRLKLVK